MMRKLVRLLPYLRQQRLLLAMIVVLTITASAITVAQPWPMKVLVDYALGDAAVPDWIRQGFSATGLQPSSQLLLLIASAATLLIFIVSSSLDVALSWAWMAAGQGMVYSLAGDVFARLQRLSLSYHRQHRVGESLDRLTFDTWSVYTITSQVLVSPFQRLTTMVCIGWVMCQMDAWLTAITFAVTPLLAAAVAYFGPRLKHRAKRGREARSKIARFVHQTVTSMPLVQAFSSETRNQAQFNALADDAVAASRAGVLVNKSFGLITGLATTVSIAVAMYAGSQRVLAGSFSIGTLLVFLAYTRILQDASSELLLAYGKLKTAEASLDRLLELLDADEEVRQSPTAIPPPQLPAERGAEIRFEHVTFGYQPQRAVLQDISLTLRSGECVALVGPTGAGKTTLAAMIPRFFDPWEGSILLNGVELPDLQLEGLRQQIALVMQDCSLLPLSVWENIALGRPQASSDEIVAAAHAAHADDFIRALPQGYDSVLGQRGSTLSGGQKQRLAIARALVADAPIIIMDEPTSALDVQTELQTIDAVDRLIKGRTTLIIAHRLSTIRRADRVVMLEAGRIVEQGAPSDLLLGDTCFARLHALQYAPMKVGA
jgi:ATP-binding cassette subfamily B protein/subfamily B ATP-binding cassette protein MsbA